MARPPSCDKVPGVNSKLPELAQINISNEGADAAAASEKNVRRRRPGLGIKRDRPRFSFVPTLSRDTVRSDTTDFDKLAMELEKLDDPEEYFLAHKRLEIAKKEYERLGGDGESNQSLPTTAPLPRQRRPGLLGVRKTTGRFKELFARARSENDEALISSQDIASQEISSQEMLSLDVPSPSNYTSHKEIIISDGASFQREFTGSAPVSRTEDNVNKLVSDFLFKNPQVLEGDKATALLDERLLIKPLSTDKRSLPDLPDVPIPDLHDNPNDLKVSGGDVFNPRSSLINAHAKLKGTSIPTPPMKQRDDSVCNADFIDSPTPPRNPFEATSLLRRRMSQLSSSTDSFSDHALVLSPVRSPLVGSMHIQSDKVEVEKILISSNLESPLQACDRIDCTTSSREGLADYSTCSVDNSAGGMRDESVAPAQPVIHSEHQILEQLSNSLQKSDPQNPGSVEQNAKNAVSRNSYANLEQPIENIQESLVTLIDQSLGATHPTQNVEVPNKPATRSSKGRKRKEINRRQSLAAAGTKWESGLRRSTRLKTRPLEYWKGERFVYGRIYSSLPTVIGVIYSSPAGGDKKSSLTVKLYVSDE